MDNQEEVISENENNVVLSDFSGLEELNETFFYLCSRVNLYSALMPTKVANFMAEKLFEEYKASYSVLATQKAIKEGDKLYILKKEKSTLIPWKFLFFSNKICRITDKELKAKFKEMFSERDKKFNNKGDL